MPLISIIIPVYNHAHTLKKCVLGIIGQTYGPVEVIIVNDGSTDEFEKIVPEVKQILFNSGINFQVINQKNSGAPAARNAGFVLSKGEYVIFWDADTVADPLMLEKLSGALKNNSQASWAYCQFRFGWKKITSHNFDPDLLRKVNYIDTTSLIRRVDFCRWDENLKRFQDWDLWLTMVEKNKTGVLVPEVLFKKIVGGRAGISNWLPRIFYQLPFKLKSVDKYQAARTIIFRKHHL